MPAPRITARPGSALEKTQINAAIDYLDAQQPGQAVPVGGQSGEILTKASDADGDATWEPLRLSGGDAYA